MENRNFERKLPEGYELAKYIDARKPMFGLVMNGIALLVLLAIAVINFALIAAVTGEGVFSNYSTVKSLGFGGVFGTILSFVYIALHELVHGYAYKKKTGEKLTFGMSWSCAYCGVPDIYVYRKPALFAVLAPFVFFGVLFLGLTVVSLAVIAFTGNLAVLNVFCFVYVAVTVLQGMHVGGCSGDLYVALLLCRRFADDRTLVRDTGPEQFFYIPVKEDEEYML